MAECIYSNKINKSFLISSFTIPVDKWDIFSECLGIRLQKGEKKDVLIYLEDKKYNATYRSVNHNSDRVTYQIVYSGELPNKLKGIYSPYSDNYDNAEGKVEIYSKHIGELEFKCYPNDVMGDINNNMVMNMTSTKDVLTYIKKYIASKGFTFDDGLIENYYLSLKSKPFVILAGTSGTGKTRLVRLFAEAMGANSDNGRYKLVSVRPDWSDSSDLFGHVNLNDKFIPGTIIDFVKQATNDRANSYFLCLDEMNLARVEYYLSDILSIIETRDWVDGDIITDVLVPNDYYGVDNDARNKYGDIRIPDNLYIVGTVNMDETTFPFSKKVLDRANTIEFSTVDLLVDFNNKQEDMQSITVDNSFLKAEYVFFKQCETEKDFVEEICIELQEINKILEKANAHVGYRVRDEIIFYMLNNKTADNLLTRNQAFDREIMQKVLPRIQGSSTAIKTMLCDLFKICAGDYDGYQTENNDIGSKMIRAAQRDTCKYKDSAKKIAYMVRRFEEDGFTAYWL